MENPMTTLSQEITNCIANGKDKRDTLIELSKYPHLSKVTIEEFNKTWERNLHTYGDWLSDNHESAESCKDWDNHEIFLCDYGEMR